MEDKELEQQKEDKQEQKEEKKEESKKAIKNVVISSICVLLFIVILLLLILLGLKNCSKGANNSSSNNQSSSQKYDYDNTKLNDVFKKLVFNQVYADMGTDNPIDNIVAVTYSDSDSLFTLNIDAKIGNNIYYYFVNNASYCGYATCVDYLLTLNLNNNLPLLEGEDYGASLLPISNEKLTNEKSASYVISESATNKYLSGYYFENNQYYVYQKVELNNTDAFPIEASKVIDIDNPLFGYYKELSKQ